MTDLTDLYEHIFKSVSHHILTHDGLFVECSDKECMTHSLTISLMGKAMGRKY